MNSLTGARAVHQGVGCSRTYVYSHRRRHFACHTDLAGDDGRPTAHAAGWCHPRTVHFCTRAAPKGFLAPHFWPQQK